MVVFAAPQCRTDGLSTELRMIEEEGAIGKTLFVMPPYHHRQMASRWQTFLSMASWFPGSQVAPWADRALVLTYGRDGIRCWHARYRREYAFAIALDKAARSILDSAGAGRGPAGHLPASTIT